MQLEECYEAAGRRLPFRVSNPDIDKDPPEKRTYYRFEHELSNGVVVGVIENSGFYRSICQLHNTGRNDWYVVDPPLQTESIEIACLKLQLSEAFKDVEHYKKLFGIVQKTNEELV